MSDWNRRAPRARSASPRACDMRGRAARSSMHYLELALLRDVGPGPGARTGFSRPCIAGQSVLELDYAGSRYALGHVHYML